MENENVQKYAVFDSMGVLFIGDESKKSSIFMRHVKRLMCALFKNSESNEIHFNTYFDSCVISAFNHDVKVGVIYHSSQKYLMQAVADRFPDRNLLFHEINEHEENTYYDFLNAHNLEADNCYYVYSGSGRREMLNKIRGFRGCAYDPLSRLNYQFDTRMAANHIYWPNARNSKTPMGPQEKELAIALLKYIILCISKQFIAKEIWTYRNIPEFVDNHANRLKQHHGDAGAILCKEGITAFERGCGCLDMWGIVKDLYNGRIYQLKTAASNVSDLRKSDIDFNMELFAYTLEAFFDCHLQSPFGSVEDSKDSPFYIKIDKSIPHLFKRARLIHEQDKCLSWSRKIRPYFCCCNSPDWPVNDADWDGEMREATAQEFFDAICT